jgi:ferrous iron transport protein B
MINIYGDYFKIVDLPGTYSLNYSDNAEKVTYVFLLNEKVDLIINVMDASLFVRSLEMTIEIMELGIPMVVALNMMDEAKFSGLEIHQDILANELNIPIVPISAIYGKGVKALTTKCYDVLRKSESNVVRFPYTQHMEQHVQRISHEIQNHRTKSYGVTDVFLAIKAIENPFSKISLMFSC